MPQPTAENRALVTLLDEVGALEPAAVEGAGPRIVRGTETALVREPEERLFLDGVWHAGLFPLAGATAEDPALPLTAKLTRPGVTADLSRITTL